MREKFGSRLGFILVSAGCAVGLGNVWKFPYMCGEYGGALFILIYLFFLAALGLPVMVAEFSVGRASQKSSVDSFKTLAPAGTRWHFMGWLSLSGNWLMMAFYTTVCGWMLCYTGKSARGDFAGTVLSAKEIEEKFTETLSSAGTMGVWTAITIVTALGICFFGVKNGVERITKIMMLLLFALILILAANSVFLPGAEKGLEFFFLPNLETVREHGVFTVAFNALAQAFFTLSIGMGSMAIFGSYLDKTRSLTGETVGIMTLDTLVAIASGLIVIPACFAFGIRPDAGPSLIFITLPNIFNQMAGGRIWGTLFFLFLSFAALSTVVAVFENIVAMTMEAFRCSRTKSVIINLIVIPAISVPCILGFNLLTFFQPLGPGSTVLDLEDFLISNNVLPLGSIIFLLFCSRKNGWGFKNFLAEANAGTGIKFPKIFTACYCRYLLPAVIIIIYIKGYWDKFQPLGFRYLIPWMSFALLCLAATALIVFSRKQSR